MGTTGSRLRKNSLGAVEGKSAGGRARHRGRLVLLGHPRLSQQEVPAAGKFRLQSETFGWRLKGTNKGSGIHPIVDCTQLLAAVKNVEIIYCHEFNNAAKGFFDRVYAKYQPLVDMAPAKALDFMASFERAVRYACGRLGRAHFGTQELFAVESLATANTAMLLQEQIKYELRQATAMATGQAERSHSVLRKKGASSPKAGVAAETGVAVRDERASEEAVAVRPPRPGAHA